MCGRFVTTSSAAQIAAHFDAEVAAEQLLRRSPNYNVAPSTDVAVVLERNGRRGLTTRQWGLVPSWAKDPAVGSRMINARVETAATKPAYRTAFKRRRCIIPVDGFYEWAPGAPGGRKQPYFISAREGTPLAFAGLWESWVDPAAAAVNVREVDDGLGPGDGEPLPLLSCTVITTDATGPIRSVHDRMPVLLAPDVWDRWLDESLQDPDEVHGLVLPTPDDLLQMWPVSTAVNSVRNNGALLVEPLTDEGIEPGEPTLF